MGVMPEGKLLFSMSVPLCLSMLLQAFYNIVDSIFVSRLGEDALTAVSLAYPIQMLMIAFSVGTGVGMNSLISRRLGERRHEDATAAANNGLALLFFTACVFMLIGIFFAGPFFRLFTDVPEIQRMGTEYLSICCIFCIGIFFQVGCERIMQSQGQNVAAMIMQMIGAVINIVFDPILIFGLLGFPALGVAGAAWATVGGQIISMICCLITLARGNFEVKPRLRGFRMNGRIVKQIYEVGLPSIVMQAIGTVMNLAMNALLIAYSTTAVAIFGIYFKIQSVIFMPVFGMNNASMSIMAYNFGARSKKRMLRTRRLTQIAALSFMSVGLLIFQLFPEHLLYLFDASPDMLSIGIPAMRIISSCFLFAAIGITNSNLFQAVGRGTYSMYISLIRQLFVLVPAAYLYSAIFGTLNAVWLCFPTAELVALALSLWMVRIVRRDLIDPLDLPLRD